MPQPNGNLTPQSGLVNPASVGNSLGQNLGQDLWKGTGALLTGGANFIGGLFNNPVTNPTPPSVATNTNTYALNGKSYNAAGDPSSTPVTSAVNYNSSTPQTGYVSLPSGSGGSSGGSSSGSNGINSYGLTSSSPNWYQLQPGETTANYNARVNTAGNIAAAVGGNTQVNNTGGSSGSGTGGGQAPAGMMYNGTGGLVPIDNSTTVNGSGQNAPISTNVATGGGTQTNFPSIVGGLASTAATSSPQYQQAQQTYEQAAQQLATLQQQGNAQNQAILGGRTGAQEAGGEQGILQNYIAGQEAPLTGQEQAAAASMAAATGQQGTQQSGLASAGQLASPQASNIFGTYNPLNPTQYTGYGGGTASPGSASTVQANYQGGVNFQQTMVPNYQSAVNDANNLVNWFSTPASQGGGQGVNPSQLNAGNALTNWAEGQNYSNPQYNQLATYLNDFSAKLSSILGANSGQVTNYKQQLVDSMLNGSSDPASIQTQMNTMLQTAQATMQGYAQTYGINWSPSGTNLSNGSNTNTSTGSTYQSYFGS